MKKLSLLLLIVMALASSCCTKIDTETHYVDEKFILVDRVEKEKVIDGDTRNVRFWTVQRVIVEGDSVMIGEIDDNGSDCGCGIITDLLWEQRNIGDTLFFEYINKDRFGVVVGDGLTYAEDYKAETTTWSGEAKQPMVVNLNSLEKERKILELERQIMSLQREIETLKEIQ